MTIKSGFFNSINGDRKYKADFFSEYFASFIGDGIFPNPSSNFQVIANDNMTVTLKKGKAWIHGVYCVDDFDFVIPIEVADGVLNRIDRVVLRLDTVARDIQVVVKKGTFASNPVAPVLQRDADAYELGIADIYVSKGAISITQANITDLRLNKELCGIVRGTVDQVDTTTIFNQYLSWFQQKKDEFNTDLIDYKIDKQAEIDLIQQQFQDDFETWFITIKDILDTNAAGNLLNMIDELSIQIAENMQLLEWQKNWKPISKIELTEPATQAVIEIGDTKKFKIIISNALGVSSSTLEAISIQFHDTTATYSWYDSVRNGVLTHVASSRDIKLFAGIPQNQSAKPGIAIINVEVSGGTALVEGCAGHPFNVATVTGYHNHIHGKHLTDIYIKPNSNAFATGTKIEVWGR